MYVDVNLSLKMSLNLKIFGVLKNTFFTVGGLVIVYRLETVSDRLFAAILNKPI